MSGYNQPGNQVYVSGNGQMQQPNRSQSVATHPYSYAIYPAAHPGGMGGENMAGYYPAKQPYHGCSMSRSADQQNIAYSQSRQHFQTSPYQHPEVAMKYENNRPPSQYTNQFVQQAPIVSNGNDHYGYYQNTNYPCNYYSSDVPPNWSGYATPSNMSEMTVLSLASSMDSLNDIGRTGVDSEMLKDKRFVLGKLLGNSIELLYVKDTNTVRMAALQIQKILSVPEMRDEVVLKSPVTAKHLLHTINHLTDVDCQRPLLKAVYYLTLCTCQSRCTCKNECTCNRSSCRCQCAIGRSILVKEDVSKVIIKAMRSNVQKLQDLSLSILHVFCLEVGNAEMKSLAVPLMEGGCVQLLINLLSRKEEKFLAFNLQCLNRMLTINDNAESIIISRERCSEIVRVLANASYDKLIKAALKLIRDISNRCTTAKMSVIAVGGVAALEAQLNHSVLNRNCLYALKNLSECFNESIKVDSLLKRLVELLDHRDQSIVTVVEQTLENLTLRSQTNRVLVTRNRGVSRLIRGISSWDGTKDIRHAIRILRNLTSQHPEVDSARREFEQTDIHGTLVTFLANCVGSLGAWSFAEEVIGLIKNLTMNPGSLSKLWQQGAYQCMSCVLVKAHQSSFSNPEEQIKMKSVENDAIFILRTMSTDPHDLAEIIHSLPQRNITTTENSGISVAELKTPSRQVVDTRQVLAPNSSPAYAHPACQGSANSPMSPRYVNLTNVQKTTRVTHTRQTPASNNTVPHAANRPAYSKANPPPNVQFDNSSGCYYEAGNANFQMQLGSDSCDLLDGYIGDPQPDIDMHCLDRYLGDGLEPHNDPNYALLTDRQDFKVLIRNGR